MLSTTNKRLSEEDLDFLRWSVLENPYIPTEPTPKQAIFLTSHDREVLYGGAAGGGKSEALLMAALQYVDLPDYHALVLRRNYPELALPGGLMDRACQWLTDTDAEWNAEKKTWRFPSGATLTFGHIDSERDKYRYQSSEFQLVAFDELTEFTESQYLFLFSRLRKTGENPVPLRMRAATNPTGPGLEWVRKRFIEGGRPFIPARYKDNPHLDVSYEESLKKLDPITRRQLMEGDWDASITGGLFRREWFRIIDNPPSVQLKCRYWDLAATPPTQMNTDPDWTVGCLMGLQDDTYHILDVKRLRGTPKEVEETIIQTAHEDGKGTMIRIEEEGGSSGKMIINHFTRLLKGYDIKGDRPTRNKVERARAFSAQVEAGNVTILRGIWVYDFLRELEAFPTQGVHDDQVDAASGAFNTLTEASMRNRRIYISSPRGVRT